MRIAAVILTVLLCAALPGCVDDGGSPPTSEPDIRGVITSIEGDEGTASVRIVWTDDPAIGPMLGYDAAQVALVDSTALRRKHDDALEDITIGDLKTGDVVEAWFTGPVAESYPVQATASDLTVIGSYGGELPVPPGLQP